jgi:hypothetical protein
MKCLRLLILAGALGASALATGCYPLSAGIFTPIPVQPWMTERMEEKYAFKNDWRTPILPPIVPGAPPPLCEDAPDEQRILRALPRVARGVPYFYEEHRDNIQIVTELLVDRIDPPRFFPLIGPAQLHHCHWKCTVFYDETVESANPFPYRITKPRVQVVYIDLDHMHQVPGQSPDAMRSVTHDLMGN